MSVGADVGATGMSPLPLVGDTTGLEPAGDPAGGNNISVGKGVGTPGTSSLFVVGDATGLEAVVGVVGDPPLLIVGEATGLVGLPAGGSTTVGDATGVLVGVTRGAGVGRVVNDPEPSPVLVEVGLGLGGL